MFSIRPRFARQCRAPYGATLRSLCAAAMKWAGFSRSTGVPVIEFRAAVVIGSGSLSFEMIRALVDPPLDGNIPEG